MKIVIAGASGRMGRALIEAVNDAEDLQLVGAFDRPESPTIGRDAGEPIGLVTGITIGDDAETAIAGADCLIDFTRPEGSLSHLQHCVRHNVKAVIGTTGIDTAGKRAIEQAAEHIALVFAPNMSVGVNATFKLLEMAARMLTDGYDVEIIEAHHRHKVDAPSGTALRMGEIIAAARGQQLSQAAIYGRHGITGERDLSTIGFSTVRGGDIVGDHTVMFAGIGERIEITHKSSSRITYALGALRATRFVKSASRGLYGMQDVLSAS